MKCLTPVTTITPASNNTDNKVFNIHASYFDLGSGGAKSLSASNTLSLLNNVVNLNSIKNRRGFQPKDSAGTVFLQAPAGKVALTLDKIDLTGITGIILHSVSQGAESEYQIEVRISKRIGK